MRRGTGFAVLMVCLIGGVTAAPGAEPDAPVSPPARQARAEYDAATARAKAEYDAKLKQAHAEYLKKLDAALEQAMNAKNLAEANRIDAAKRATAAVPGEGGGPSSSTSAGVFLADLEEAAVSALQFGKKGWAHDGKSTVGGTYCPNALYVHPQRGAPAVVRYEIGGRFKTLRGEVGLNDTIKTRAESPAVFRVVGDGRTLWTSDPMQSAGVTKAFSVSVSGVKTLELQVQCAGDHTNAHWVWVNPQLAGK